MFDGMSVFEEEAEEEEEEEEEKVKDLLPVAVS